MDEENLQDRIGNALTKVSYEKKNFALCFCILDAEMEK